MVLRFSVILFGVPACWHVMLFYSGGGAESRYRQGRSRFVGRNREVLLFTARPLLHDARSARNR